MHREDCPFRVMQALIPLPRLVRRKIQLPRNVGQRINQYIEPREPRQPRMPRCRTTVGKPLLSRSMTWTKAVPLPFSCRSEATSPRSCFISRRPRNRARSTGTAMPSLSRSSRRTCPESLCCNNSMAARVRSPVGSILASLPLPLPPLVRPKGHQENSALTSSSSSPLSWMTSCCWATKYHRLDLIKRLGDQH